MIGRSNQSVDESGEGGKQSPFGGRREVKYGGSVTYVIRCRRPRRRGTSARSKWSHERLLPNRTRHYGGHAGARVGAFRAADSASHPKLPDQRQAIPAVIYPRAGNRQE